uniref:Coiled-coil domain containing 137 n=1 Tax=Rousettus aegyptiacus TaxID=9407 RepID=A0A7J8G641_ROUAE|nr:coiled-coil domain containing 137 [Rousettus aegyptiacus]
MAGGGCRTAISAASTGPGRPGRPQGRRQQQLQGKQRSAPWPKPRSKEKKKVNCKPKNQDEQEIPFRLREIMRSRQEMKNPVSNKKRKKEAQVAFRKTEEEARGVDADIAVPKFRQRKWESDKAYIQRMEQEAQHVLFLSKNQADRQPEAQAAPKKKSEGKKAFQRRRLDKARQRKEEKAADRLEQELLQDTVKFGEVALQPPELTAKPKTARQEVADAGGASEPRQCVPASGHLAGPTADRGRGESACRAGLQGAEEAAAAAPGGSVSPPPSREEARALSVVERDQGCHTGAGGMQMKVLFPDVPWDPRAWGTGSQVQLQVLVLVFPPESALS